jgi:aspartate/methionine/tyrosine aminotransferase
MGWVEADDKTIQSLESIQGVSCLSPDTLHQMAFTRYINNNIENGGVNRYINDMRQKYDQIARFTSGMITKHLKLPHFNPQGGLFTCIRVGCDGEIFSNDLWEKEKILVIAGIYFGNSTKDAVRISFGPVVDKPDVIESGIIRMGKFIHGT